MIIIIMVLIKKEAYAVPFWQLYIDNDSFT